MALGLDGVLVLGVTAALLLLLFFEKASLTALGLGLVVALGAAGIVDAQTAVAGFANKAVLTIAGLYVIGEGLTRSGAVGFLGRILTHTGGGSESRTVLVTGLVAALFSAFLNDTAVVVVFIPILIDIAAKTGIPASRLLMPLAFAALLGGVCTLVGTSTNIIVSGVAEALGATPLGMFSLTPVGAPMAVLGVLFMAAAGRHLLPVRQSLTVMMAKSRQRDFVTELGVGDASPLIGRRYADAFGDSSARVLCFVRRAELRHRPFESERIQAGDIVMLSCGIEDIARLQGTLGLEWMHGLKIDPRSVELFEVALSPRSALVGESIEDLRLHERFGVTAMAILRAGQHLHDRIGQLPVKAGDVLLVCGDDSSRERLRLSEDFSLLAGEPQPLHLPGKAKLALLIAAAVVLLLSAQSIFHWDRFPASFAALAGAVAMVAARCVSTQRAFAAIDWPILIFIAGTLALGEAMRATGVAAFCAGGVVDVLAPWGVAAVVSGLILLCFLFNFLVGHSAVAVLFTPIALATAGRLATDSGFASGSVEAEAIVRALLLAVCIGGSMCFATPIAHQVNLMVCGAGGYRYRDFLRMGLPLALLAWLAATATIPLVTGV